MQMKYILLMSGSAAGVDTYRAWSQKEREMHMAALGALARELTESGEFVATQGLAEPGEAKVVRGEKNGLPVTDGIFPESKEFLLGYWIVDVAVPERFRRHPGREAFPPTCQSRYGSLRFAKLPQSEPGDHQEQWVQKPLFRRTWANPEKRS